jgi:hypothetical protein
LQAPHSNPQNPDTDESQFWRAQRPRPQPRPNGDGFIQDEWPFEDECHNVALLKKLKWLIITADANRPLPILRRPKTPHDIAANLRGFSDEACDSPLRTPPSSACKRPQHLGPQRAGVQLVIAA